MYQKNLEGWLQKKGDLKKVIPKKSSFFPHKITKRFLYLHAFQVANNIAVWLTQGKHRHLRHVGNSLRCSLHLHFTSIPVTNCTWLIVWLLTIILLCLATFCDSATLSNWALVYSIMCPGHAVMVMNRIWVYFVMHDS